MRTREISCDHVNRITRTRESFQTCRGDIYEENDKGAVSIGIHTMRSRVASGGGPSSEKFERKKHMEPEAVSSGSCRT